MLDKLIFLVALAGTAVVYADVLVRDGMLLQPVQRWLRLWYGKPRRPVAFTYIKEDSYGPVNPPLKTRCLGPEVSKSIDEQWWWKPLWGCPVCVAGQWGFWGYIIYIGQRLPASSSYHPEFFRSWAAHLFGWVRCYRHAYSPFEHLAFTAFTILAAIILHRWSQD